ncbi:MAG: prepilin-type N-terminal cleavage/methylation domain-containing protein [Myxococcales bacterium]|nr:prepilin-type N-terminal cleavage/methylation domain-containing protein [Myxococcales bacterium]
MSRRHRAQGGYTLIEVLASMAVLATGLMGILALQGSTTATNQRAQEITMATNVARRWQERLRRDGLQWTAPSQSNAVSNIQNTWYLRPLQTQVNTGWVIPAQPMGLTAAPEFAAADYFGNDVPVASNDRYYCTHVRLVQLVPNELVRAEVRVWWYRRGGTRLPAYDNCGTTSALGTMGQDTTNLRWVYLTQTIARHEL